jgi:hypothetical protein
VAWKAACKEVDGWLLGLDGVHGGHGVQYKSVEAAQAAQCRGRHRRRRWQGQTCALYEVEDVAPEVDDDAVAPAVREARQPHECAPDTLIRYALADKPCVQVASDFARDIGR